MIVIDRFHFVKLVIGEYYSSLLYRQSLIGFNLLHVISSSFFIRLKFLDWWSSAFNFNSNVILISTYKNSLQSSAVSQCCLGRVIPLTSVCCLNGKSVNQNNLCQCSAPSQKWTKERAYRGLSDISPHELNRHLPNPRLRLSKCKNIGQVPKTSIKISTKSFENPDLVWKTRYFRWNKLGNRLRQNVWPNWLK